ncbi:MAG TPA: hypothetical protein VFR19_13480 [Hyphomicrobiaceae bacterium]|jgi:hypothetical protein|nr:hypothetical protein [Hyphomicrobiaceae bacterium]
MSRLVLSALTGALLSGLLLATPAEAAFNRHGYGKITPAEHAAIARSQRQLSVIKAKARADGHVTAWERAKIAMAQSRHNALLYRLQHN